MIINLLGRGVLNLEQYEQLRDEYIARNLYLNIFQISAPRGFEHNNIDQFAKYECTPNELKDTIIAANER